MFEQCAWLQECAGKGAQYGTGRRVSARPDPLNPAGPPWYDAGPEGEMLSAGEIVGPYEIGEVLGEGGMAVVYAARHVALGTSHALKVLRPEILAIDEIRGRFLAEARLLANLRLPGVVEVTDIVASPGVAGIVMARLHGPTLAEWAPSATADARREVFRAIVEIVAAVHERGIVHRDLKPDNVVLLGTPPHPTLLDFGIAKQASNPSDTRTRVAMRMGTPAYMSPEQIVDSGAVDARSDVWSLGVMLYELMSGVLPFAGAADAEVYAAVLKGAYTPAERRVAGLPAPVRTAITLALSAQPSDRPPDARALLAVLDGAEEERPVGAARVDRWRDLLLDLSLRNRLLNFRPTVKKVVRVEAPSMDTLEEVLSQGKPIQFVGRPVEGRRPLDVLPGADTPEGSVQRAAAFARGQLLSDLTAPELDRRCTALARDARVAIEDAGSNMLFCAIGLLAWRETQGAEVRLAPLLLYPVRLTRTAGGWEMARGAEDPVPNRALLEKMTREHGLALGALADPPLDENGLDMPAIFAAVRGAIEGRGWEVRDEAWIGLFTFAKFTMWRDLRDHSVTLLQNPLTRALAAGQASPEIALRKILPAEHTPLPLVLDADATQTEAVRAAIAGENMVLQGPPGTGKSQTIANLIAVSVAAGKTVLFVAEKLAALDVVHRRLQQVGIGDACLELHSNKASKRQIVEELGRTLRARSEVVPGWDRAAADVAGLGTRLDAHVLALHCPRATGESVFGVCEVLVGRADAHRIGRIDPIAFASPEASLALMEAVEELAAAVAAVEPVADNPWRDLRPDPARLDGLGPAYVREAESAASATADHALALQRAAGELAAALGQPAPTGRTATLALARVAECIAASGDVDLPGAVLADRVADPGQDADTNVCVSRLEDDDARRAELATRYRDTLYRLPVAGLSARFRAWAGSFFLFSWFFLRKARASVARVVMERLPSNQRIAMDLQLAERVLADAPGLEEVRMWTRTVLPSTAGEAAEPARLRRVLAWLADAREAADACVGAGAAPDRAMWIWAGQAGDPDRQHRAKIEAQRTRAALDAFTASVTTLEAALALPANHQLWLPPKDARHVETVGRQLAEWRTSAAWPRLRAWVRWRQARARAGAVGAASVVTAAEQGAVAAARLIPAFERARGESWLEAALEADPALRDFTGAAHQRMADRFATADQGLLAVARSFVRGEASRRRPDDAAATEGSQKSLLIRETRRQRGHLPVRTLIGKIPDLLPRLKPCMLMSPLSVAQYLPPDWRFDLVVFDEASQICTHDAVGAVARGRQVVVVGDTRQLPPTNFFAVQTDEGGSEGDVAELESVLDELAAAGLPQRMLRWHYRSRHESLIAFSNHAYYDGDLVTFPSAVARGGVQWRPVAGVYDRAGTATNAIEARALVKELVGRLLAGENRSFGVVTFSRAQQVFIEDLLDDARRANPAIERYFAPDQAEPMFVKNLENVQGDERDVMYFSICYGPDANGAVSLNFGPLSQRGGERRLNVAITRAKHELILVSSLRADHIDASRTSAIGTRHLRDFLAYVAAGGRSAAAVDAAPEAPLAADVAAELVARGHDVVLGVGQGKERVDVAVRAKRQDGHCEDHFLLGIELDGATYRDAGRARDRDRLRGQVLGGLGWRLHRVWALDWVQDRAREIERLIEAIAAAGQAPPASPEAPTAGDAEFDAAEDLDLEDDGPAPAPRVTLAPYVKATIPEGQGDFYTSPERIREQLAILVEAEAPIHVMVAHRRVAAAWGISRLGSRVSAALEAATKSLSARHQLHRHGDFLWRPTDDPSTWSEARAALPGDPAREARTIAPEEVATVMARLLAQDVSMPKSALCRAAAQTFGISRLGAGVEEAMGKGVAVLVRRGVAREVGERVVWAG